MTKAHLTIGLILIFLSSVASATEDMDYFNECNNPDAGNTTIPFTGTYKSHQFKPECAPDTLYSWQQSSELASIDLEKTFLNSKGYSYTWRTPLATFAYGDTQIRIKLKKGITFRWISLEERDCRNFTKEVSDTTVFAAYGLEGETYNHMNFSEYLICSPLVAESWSVNTKGAFLEASKELNYIIDQHLTENEVPNYDAYKFKKERKRFHPNLYWNPFFSSVNDPGTDWSTNALNTRFIKMRNMAFAKTGKIYPALKVESRSHFKSEANSYFKLSSEELLNQIETQPSQPVSQFISDIQVDYTLEYRLALLGRCLGKTECSLLAEEPFKLNLPGLQIIAASYNGGTEHLSDEVWGFLQDHSRGRGISDRFPFDLKRITDRFEYDSKVKKVPLKDMLLTYRCGKILNDRILTSAVPNCDRQPEQQVAPIKIRYQCGLNREYRQILVSKTTNEINLDCR